MKACTGASICLAKGKSTAHSSADSAMTRHARWRTEGLAGRVARNRRLSSPEGAVVDVEGCGGRDRPIVQHAITRGMTAAACVSRPLTTLVNQL